MNYLKRLITEIAVRIQQNLDWCQTPGQYVAYRVGFIYTTDNGLAFTPTKQSSQMYLNKNNGTASKYKIKISNPFVAKDVKDGYHKIIRNADQQLLDTINVNNIVSGRRSLHSKIVLATKKLGYDSIVYTNDKIDLGKYRLILFDNSNIIKEY